MTFFKRYPNCLKRLKNVVWQSADGRVTSDHCRVTVQWLFSKNFLIAWNVQKTLFEVGRLSRDLRPLSRDRSATFYKNFNNCLKRPKKRCLTVGRRSRDLRPRRVTVQWLFSKDIQIAWNIQKRCLTVGRRSRDLRPLSRDRWVTFFKNFPNCLKRLKNVVWQSADGRVTSDHCRVTVQWLFSKNVLIAWNVQKTLFDSRPRDLRPLSRDRSVTFNKIVPNCLKRPKTLFDSRPTAAWPPTTVAWPFSDFFQKFS